MNRGSSIFMAVGTAALVILLALPLLISPMTWGRRLGWKIPEQADLANYLGRSLGGVALAIAVMGYMAARDPWKYRFVFDLVILIGIFMAAVHAYGFFKKVQPMIESVETLVYAVVSFLAWHLYPVEPR
jgi:hypothetical protein